MTTEKRMIKIRGVEKITKNRVSIILADSGKCIWLPINEAERYGDRVFIPTWLAKKYKVLNDPC